MGKNNKAVRLDRGGKGKNRRKEITGYMMSRPLEGWIVTRKEGPPGRICDDIEEEQKGISRDTVTITQLGEGWLKVYFCLRENKDRLDSGYMLKVATAFTKLDKGYEKNGNP